MCPGLGFTELQADPKEAMKAPDLRDRVEQSWQDP